MEKKQVIIAIGREYGSGGHAIAEKLAERFELPFYDHNLLDEIANEKNIDVNNLQKYDEVPRNRLFSRTVKGYSNSPEEVIANMQFDFLRQKAEAGDSFVVVGRCAETILKDYKGLISIFILGDMDKKKARVAEIYNMSDTAAESKIMRHDKKRKSYHNYYCEGKWGDSRNYDLTINSSKMGIEKTMIILEEYVKGRIETFD